MSSLWLLDREDDRPLDFHGAFIPAVAEGLILRHTQPGDWIWDPMAGSGTTGREAKRLGRCCVMSDLNPTRWNIIEGDARSCQFHRYPSANLPVGSCPTSESWPLFQFDLAILHPPYHRIVRFSDKHGDLSNAGSIGRFLRMFEDVCRNVGRHLKPKGYLGLVVGDIWVTEEEAKVEPMGLQPGVFPLAHECMYRAMHTLGQDARLKAIVVKDIKNNQARAHERNLWSSRYFKWGAVHFAHEYIFSIQKGT
ncbi:MAG: hypothetical protein GWN58_26320 [Anaerolineae bacterium]|nr:hypothetical protein [Anaerolineae bacterium]